jgi:FKBP-type peptidyl-prolyl cis-trans isomerase FkpA
MKKILFAVVVFASLAYFSGCTKSTPGYISCTGVSVDDDSSALLMFARHNNINAVRDTTGLYYQIIDTGTGTYPTIYNRIYVTYTAETLDGVIFDSTTQASNTGFLLNSLIPAWEIGLPKIKTGGHIKLLVPSALGYGCAGGGNTVAANTPIYFDVNLASIQ